MNPTKAGIWMDHNHAYLIEFTVEPMTATLIESKLNHGLKPNLKSGETRMHAIEQHDLSAYFKDLSHEIRKYQEVILFGPGSAKTELFNHLRENHLFHDIKLKTEPTDKLTEGEMKSFVRKHFEKHF